MFRSLEGIDRASDVGLVVAVSIGLRREGRSVNWMLRERFHLMLHQLPHH